MMRKKNECKYLDMNYITLYLTEPSPHRLEDSSEKLCVWCQRGSNFQRYKNKHHIFFLEKFIQDHTLIDTVKEDLNIKN